MAGKGAGILEANPAALAIVILFFLVFTLGFEHLLHWAKHALIKRKKFGALAALNNFSSEIMLLGLASLLLMTFEDRIAKICYPTDAVTTHATLQPWLSRVVGTQDVKGCACCLGRTKYVTECFLESKKCPSYDGLKYCCKASTALVSLKHKSDVITPDRVDTCDADAVQYKAAKYGAAGKKGSDGKKGRRRLYAEEEQSEEQKEAAENKKCSGARQLTYAECGNEPGKAPMVSIKTLHDVHMLLFFMAVTHIIVGLLVLLLSTAKLKFYARRGGAEREDKLAIRAIRAAQAAHDSGLETAASGPAGALRSKQTTAHAAAAAAAAGGDVRDQEKQPGGEYVEPPSAFVLAASAPVPAADEPEPPVDVVDPWHGQPEHMGWTDWLLEIGVYIFRQLTLLQTVSKQEYSVLRACFYYTHAHTVTKPVTHDSHHEDAHADDNHHDLEHAHSSGLHNTHSHGSTASSAPPPLRPDQVGGSYAPYLTEMVERDGASVVGLGLPMWVLVLLFVVVSGVIGWCTWLFMVLAGVLLLFVNIVLLGSVRHLTKGGKVVRQQQAWYHWLHRSFFLINAIKLMLFFFTFVISNSIFMAAYFGPDSCFFSRTGFQTVGKAHLPLPWWVIMLVNILLLLNLALFTLPLYSLTSHTLKVDRALLQSTVRDRLFQQACRELKKASMRSGNVSAHGKHNSDGSGGHGSGGIKAAASRLLHSVSSNFRGMRGPSPVVQQQQHAAPVSDDKRWQRLHEAHSV